MMTLTKSKICVKKSPIHGFGVFAEDNIPAGQVIEQCYVLFFEDHTENLVDYTFDVSDLGYEKESGIPLGYGAIYNHASIPNANYFFDQEHKLLHFVARIPIPRGDEITVCYGNDWFSSRDALPMEAFTWFHIKKRFRQHQRLVRMLLVCTSLVLALLLFREVPIVWLYSLLQNI